MTNPQLHHRSGHDAQWRARDPTPQPREGLKMCGRLVADSHGSLVVESDTGDLP